MPNTTGKRSGSFPYTHPDDNAPSPIPISKAMNMLKSRLYQVEIEKRNKKKEEVESTKMKIDFGSQIRNYVLHPYKLVKDNRTGFERSDVQNVLNGDINDFMKAFLMEQ